jgi:sugar phosphate isomerase/epimerase
MPYAVANRALPRGHHAEYLPELAALGYEGVEVVAAATWDDCWHGPSAGEVACYARQLRRSGLQPLGVRVSLDDHPGLSLLGDEDERKRTEAYLAHLSAVCRDLGGRTLVVSEGRFRGELPLRRAWSRCQEFFTRLLPRIEAHGTVVCLAQQVRAGGDFCLTATECRVLADVLEHPSFGLQINAAALLESKEADKHSVFASLYGRLDLFVANEPELAPLGQPGCIDHAALRRHLSAGGYRGWICLDQESGSFEQLRLSTHGLRSYYGRADNESLRRGRQFRFHVTSC